MLTPTAVSSDLRDFFYAEQVSTSIAAAVTVGLSERPGMAYGRLREARFDQAPVCSGKRPVGWVAVDDLNAHLSVESGMTPLDECTLVSAESSIATVLQLLPQKKFLYVVNKDGLSGFIVQSDLDRHAVRSYLYLLIASIEMLLSEIVKHAIPEKDITASLRSDMKKRFERAQSAGQETSPAEYLYLSELITLFAGTSCAQDPKYWDGTLTDLLEKVKGFRNDVMHPTRSIAASENIQIVANLPGWAARASGMLRDIIAVLGQAPL